jgi:hypothetical protein
LASNTKKREGKIKSSLGFFFELVVISVGVAVPSPRVLHSWRRKRWVDNGLGGLKTHRCTHLALTLLKSRKPLTHLLGWLTDESVIGATHGDQSLEALDEDVLLLATACSSMRRLKSSWRCRPTRRRRRRRCTGRRRSRDADEVPAIAVAGGEGGSTGPRMVFLMKRFICDNLLILLQANSTLCVQTQ